MSLGERRISWRKRAFFLVPYLRKRNRSGKNFISLSCKKIVNSTGAAESLGRSFQSVPEKRFCCGRTMVCSCARTLILLFFSLFRLCSRDCAPADTGNFCTCVEV
jgi:hypothetical protein